jgi:16S rRNA (guanine966-N2)-methyltransferase
MIRLRIVGGRLRGRALARPEDLAIRPTSDRTREAVFNILAHGAAAVSLDGVRVIDLFAGTGALGIEAISRGAAYALFVDESAEARGLIRENVEALGLTGFGPASQLGQFGLAFLDPPYGKLLGDQALASLLAGGWLAPGAVVVLEEREGVSVAVPAGLQAIEQRSYGDTQVMFLRAS